MPIKYPTRQDFIASLNLSGKACAEVGVLVGDFANCILARNPKELYLIDIWKHQDPTIYPDKANSSDQQQEQRYNYVVRRFKDYPNVKIIRNYSVSAAAAFGDNSLDFVYLDANHLDTAVYADIVAWMPKVKIGGLLCGHDYLNKNRGHTVIEVKTAVDRFLNENNLELEIITGTKFAPTWGVRRSK